MGSRCPSAAKPPASRRHARRVLSRLALMHAHLAPSPRIAVAASQSLRSHVPRPQRERHGRRACRADWRASPSPTRCFGLTCTRPTVAFRFDCPERAPIDADCDAMRMAFVRACVAAPDNCIPDASAARNAIARLTQHRRSRISDACRPRILCNVWR